MFKKILCATALLLTMLIGLVITSYGQDKQSITVSGVFLRKDNKVELPNGNDFKFNPARDSFGAEFAYDYAVHPNVAIGIQLGATFHDQQVNKTYSCGTGCVATKSGDSVVALAWADYYVKLQRSKGTFRPYIKGTIGAARGDFGGVTFSPGGFVSSSANMFTYGAEPGIGVKVGKKTEWVTGVGFKQLIGGDVKQFDLSVKTGLRWSF